MSIFRRSKKFEASKGAGIAQDMELAIPTHFRCPISLDLMKDPVTLSTGITYDRENIEKWIEMGNSTCPVTHQVLLTFNQIPNHTVRKMIQDWCVANKSCGVERIPTPRIPATPNKVAAICSRIEVAMRNGDRSKCRELLEKIEDLAKEDASNKRCLAKNGIGYALVNMFESFAHYYNTSNDVHLKEILSALTWVLPLDKRVISKLNSDLSLRTMTQILKRENDLSLKQDTVLVLNEVVSVDQDSLEVLMRINEDIEDILFHVIKSPISPNATTATLAIIHRIIISSSPEQSAARFVQMGLIPLILELLVDCDKSLCEKGLAVIDSMCCHKDDRESACDNALTIPLLVKKVLTVSTAATEAAVSTLRKLCFGENKNVMLEAMKFGAFQKLLVVLQMDVGEGTKANVTQLLKLMNNVHRHDFDYCFDSLY
ncbi:U-box domain-containing protein 21-like [Andrographis paniculata]|uniref:U-box domain-containing protein 21-like n=1 Tax=Andrographis paniculata TaxID=175694 RepID=UPI0021E844D9|nr:U-box domain-containing protein 21-like [Andrographis paniculata]